MSFAKNSACFAISAVLVYYLKQYMNGGVCTSTARIDGKVVIITGPSAGIGKETALDMVKRGGRVYMGCRSIERCEMAAADIKNITNADASQIRILKLDLASVKSIRNFVKEFSARETQLDILINNAGVAWIPELSYTEDGFELTFGTNHLGHFLLTNLLMGHLMKGKPSRVVTVSSKAALRSSGMNWDDLMIEKSYQRFHAYSNSKLANVMFSRELGRRLKGQGVTTYSLHPGVIVTDLGRYSFPYASTSWLRTIVYYIAWPLWKSTYHGAQTTICCAVDENLAQETGLHYWDCAEKDTPEFALSDENNKHLWDVSVELVQLKPDEIHPLLK